MGKPRFCKRSMHGHDLAPVALIGNTEQVSFALAGSFSVMLRQMPLDVAMLRLRVIFLA